MGQTNRRIFSRSEWAQLVKELSLSPREAQIVKLLCAGHKNYSAACTLGISAATVRTYLSRLYAKLGVSDRFELLCLLFHTARNSCSPNG